MSDTNAATRESLCSTNCVPCEGGVPKLTREQAGRYASAVPEWTLADDAGSISRKLNCGNFVKAVRCLNGISEIAEAQQHHPDLHLTGYRHLKVVLTTHAIGGLSENDFIVAAHIDRALESNEA